MKEVIMSAVMLVLACFAVVCFYSKDYSQKSKIVEQLAKINETIKEQNILKEKEIKKMECCFACEEARE